MMSPQTIKFIIAAVLLLHGLGHLGALGGILYHTANQTRGDWLSDRSWLLTTLPEATAKTMASVFWILAALGFILTTMAFLGFVITTDFWPLLAVISSIVSAIGIILFLGTWPTFNTIAALAVNIAVLVTQLWMHWPPKDVLTG